MSADNGFHLIGNLTRDAELKYTASGTAVCKFSIAYNKKYKDNSGAMKEEVSYFEATLWGKSGESLHQYLTKGKLVGIEGEMKQDRWEQDGQSRSKVELVVSHVRLLSSGNREGGQGQERGGYDQEPSRSGGSSSWQHDAPPRADGRSPAPASDPATGRRAAPDDFNDDIPFD